MRKVLAIGAAALLVLGAGVVKVATHSSDSVSYPTAWDKRVLPIVEFVEKNRGLTFKHPVPVSFLDDTTFNSQVAVKPAESKKDKADLATFLGTLRALGLVSGEVDLNKQLDTLLKSDVIGLYVPAKRAVFVRGKELTPYVRVTLAHELTHVLQDQYFDLVKLKKDAPGGDSTAVTALIEGDAVRIQKVYEKKLSSADQKSYATAQEGDATRGQDAADVPEILSNFLSFPYAFGPVLLEVLVQEDGNAAVDRAFKHPPSEEAQILDPVGHPLTEKARAVADPALPAGAKRLDKVAPFGQVSLFEVLGSRLDYATSWDAVAQWQGDAYVPYSLGGKTCVAIDVSSNDANTLLSAASAWAKRLPGTTAVVTDGLVKIRACDPGAGAPAPAKAAVSVFTILQVRAQIIEQILTSGGDFAAGRCVADGVIAGLGTHQADLGSNSLPPERLGEIRSLFATIGQHCRDTGHA